MLGLFSILSLGLGYAILLTFCLCLWVNDEGQEGVISTRKERHIQLGNHGESMQ